MASNEKGKAGAWGLEIGWCAGEDLSDLGELPSAGCWDPEVDRILNNGSLPGDSEGPQGAGWSGDKSLLEWLDLWEEGESGLCRGDAAGGVHDGTIVTSGADTVWALSTAFSKALCHLCSSLEALACLGSGGEEPFCCRDFLGRDWRPEGPSPGSSSFVAPHLGTLERMAYAILKFAKRRLPISPPTAR